MSYIYNNSSCSYYLLFIGYLYYIPLYNYKNIINNKLRHSGIYLNTYIQILNIIFNYIFILKLYKGLFIATYLYH
jgi:hypothetical protein